jgi:general secretion pathway protein L
MSSLFIQLPIASTTPETEFSFVLSPDGRRLGRTGCVPAPMLPAAAGAGSEVVAVVPVAQLAWHRVTWPRGVTAGTPRLRAALEGLLEEALLDEPESVHFAMEPGGRPGQALWVAVCGRAWLRDALQALEAAGRGPSRVVPEVAPEAPTAWLAMGDPEEAWLVARGPAGVLRMPLGPGIGDLMPGGLAADTLLLAEPGVSAQAEAWLHRPAVLQSPAQRWLLAAQSRWNLAQFDLAQSRPGRWGRRITGSLATLWRAPVWRPARWALGLLLVSQLVGLNTWAWLERRALDAKARDLRHVLTGTFPQVRVVVDPRVQMEREVERLRQATGAPSPGDLEAMLGVVAGLPGADASMPTELDYAPASLRVRGLGWSAEQMVTASAALRPQGLRLRRDGEWVVFEKEPPR